MATTTEDFVLDLMRHSYGQSAAVAVPGPAAGSGFLGRFPAGLDNVLDYIRSTAGHPASGPVDWFFLIGGPGNGKSRAVQQLAAALGIDLPASSAKGPTSRSFPEAWPSDTYVLQHARELVFINDASIDRRGGLTGDIGDAFRVVEAGRRLTLFANVNRGVLVDELARPGADERELGLVKFLAGFRDGPGGADENYYAHQVVQAGHATVRVHAISLDVLSLIEPAPGGSSTVTFEGGEARAARYRTIGSLHQPGRPHVRLKTAAGQLLTDLASKERWADCEAGGCPAAGQCPFRANATWLRDADLATHYLEALRGAEVTSGWRLAYRELLAEFATAFLGPIEPSWSTGTNPCDWVRDVASRPDADLGASASLAIHRTYATVFGGPPLDAAERRASEAAGVGATLSVLGSGRAPRVKLAVEAIRPSRDTGTWPAPGETDLKLAATAAVEVMAVSDGEAPSAWAAAQAALPPSAHSGVEERLDRALKAHLTGAYGEPDAPRAQEARVLMKLRLHLLLSQVGLAAGRLHKQDEILAYLGTQRLLLDGEEAPDRVVSGLANLIIGSGHVNLFSPRASTIPAQPGATQVSVQLAATVRPQLKAEGDQLVMKVMGAAGAWMPVSFDLFREALVAAEPKAGFTDIPDIQLARIERARASLVSRKATKTLNLVVTLKDGRKFRIRPYMDDEHFELVETLP